MLVSSGSLQNILSENKKTWLQEKYNDIIEVLYSIKIYENGLFNSNYNVENVIKRENIQEAGLKFLMGDNFQELAWNRNAYFTAYPKNSLGSSTGKIDLTQKPEMNYREKLTHSWEMDSKGFFYFGLEEELPYTNIVRSLKENIYSYSLKTKTGSKIELFSNGTQACRFDKIDGENTLIIDELWDYNSLLWGNYMKLIKLGGEFVGSVIFKVD